MIELDIAKRNMKERIIYGLVIFIVLLLAVLVFIGRSSFGTPEVVMLFAIVLLVFAMFQVIPNLPIKKHFKIGSIQCSSDRIFIDYQARKQEIMIDQFDGMNIKLIGYDGQHRLGDIESLGKGNSSLYDPIRPIDGLDNMISYTIENHKYQFKIYIPDLISYNDFKSIINEWTNQNSKIRKTYIR